ncbi:MAG TPA: DUF721 domain-containing protein [Candidatus Rubrimentiphilum sp.]|nr:DUF721 domain-containing protein [Candidatus Rubrimentiphilum sp.]
MQPLRSLLSAWQPGSSDLSDPLSQIRAQWTTIVGDEIAANSRPVELARGALIVVTRSSAWSQQLSFLSERIIAAVAQATQTKLDQVRFRVGRVAQRQLNVVGRKEIRRSRLREVQPAPTLDSAVATFREDVQKAQRAKASAGWKECNRCGAPVVADTEALCSPCANARANERAATLARLLFEVPFLGYAGIAEHVENLSRNEYDSVRSKLLARWWDLLTQLRASGRARVTKYERDVASSYVLLKTELDPERIAPPVVRDLLGDDLYNMLYGSEQPI